MKSIQKIIAQANEIRKSGNVPAIKQTKTLRAIKMTGEERLWEVFNLVTNGYDGVIHQFRTDGIRKTTASKLVGLSA